MKLKFEIWVDSGGFSSDAKHLLYSGATCYKAEAYSAALLMSYLGFLVVMKDRLMESDKPPLFPIGQWDKMIKQVQLEDHWESTILDALKQQEKYDSTRNKTQDAVFTCNDSIRAQIVYWKDRRNDCVHHKDNEITNAHVETFWSFLESNVQKITVPGGMASLINKFIRFYDSTYTPAHQDIYPLVTEIKDSVEKSNLPEFWKLVFDVMNDLLDYKREVRFIGNVLKLGDPAIEESLIKYLKSEEKTLLQYIAKNPAIIQKLGYTAQEIRNLWNTKILKLPEYLGIYASMLRFDLIPENERKEANKLYSKKLKYTSILTDHQTLMESEFGEALHNEIFVSANSNGNQYWKFLHANAKVVRDFIEFYPLKDDVVAIISKVFNEAYYPYALQTELNDLFSIDSKKRQEFLDIANRLTLTPPIHLASLS